MVDAKWSSDAWQRLADEIKSARAALGLNQLELAAKAGCSERTVQDLEAGISRGRMPRKIPNIESALGWRPGTARAIVTAEGSSPLPPVHQIPAPVPRPVRMTAHEKAIVRRYVDGSTMSSAHKRRILTELDEIPEDN